MIRATNGNGRGGWGATTDGFDRLQFLELQEGHADLTMTATRHSPSTFPRLMRLLTLTLADCSSSFGDIWSH